MIEIVSTYMNLQQKYKKEGIWRLFSVSKRLIQQTFESQPEHLWNFCHGGDQMN